MNSRELLSVDKTRTTQALHECTYIETGANDDDYAEDSVNEIVAIDRPFPLHFDDGEQQAEQAQNRHEYHDRPVKLLTKEHDLFIPEYRKALLKHIPTNPRSNFMS